MKDSDAAALKEDGYLVLKELDNGKSIAVTRMFASTALCLMTEDYNDKAVKRYWDGRERRFCYQHHVEAVLAGLLWDGTSDPKGDWVKEKSPGVERLNPRFNDPDFLGGDKSDGNDPPI